MKNFHSFCGNLVEKLTNSKLNFRSFLKIRRFAQNFVILRKLIKMNKLELCIENKGITETVKIIKNFK